MLFIIYSGLCQSSKIVSYSRGFPYIFYITRKYKGFRIFGNRDRDRDRDRSRSGDSIIASEEALLLSYGCAVTLVSL
jgi:hypothetical protein